MQLHLWMASHVHCAQRLDLLRRCICSLNAQTQPFDRLCLSVSVHRDVADLCTQAAIEAAFDAKTRARLTLLWHGTAQKSQFEHYNVIANEYALQTGGGDADVWVCFHDDDDLSRQTRCERLRRAILQRKASTRMICHHLVRDEDGCAFNLSDDSAQLWTAFDCSNDDDPVEYLQMCCRVDIVRLAMLELQCALSYPLCDLFARSSFRRLADNNVEWAGAEPLYFYRYHHHSRAWPALLRESADD